MSFVSINPTTGRVLQRHKPDASATVEQAIARAHRRQLEWARTPLAERAHALRSVHDQLLGKREELARLMAVEMGKPLREGVAEIEKCAAACAYFATHGPAFLEPESRPGAPAGARVVYRPLGVVLAIMPWNFPFWQVFRALAPALLAGNAVLLKHAPNVTGCARAIAGLVRAAGLPAHLVEVVLVEPPAVARLIADPRIRLVTLTGSTAAGRAVAERAGAALKPCILELGGSDAYLVLEDADLDHAARTLTAGRLINGGQSCIAAKRWIVHRRVLPAFEDRVREAFAARQQGDPLEPATDLGPMARDDLRAAVHRQVQRSVRAGARLLLGGRLPRGPGFFYPPTILSRVPANAPAAREETFGPAAAILSARDEKDAVALANATDFGLGGGVFTRDLERGRRLAEESLACGAAFVNDFVKSDPALPFGGVKDSGYGRELSAEGLRAMCNVKTMLVRPPS